ncbi:MAG TPA: DoxX family protein, partial [Thermoanaerobaculia bacterium]|nr:DoxX family protein [Thermoanaerobaculia bacterium]
GTQKLFGWPGGKEPAGAAMMKFAGVVELAGGLLIAFGLFTSVAAFICAGQMAAAYFMAHARESFWPVLNQGELAALYCFVFLFFAAHGSGIWSVDSARRRTDASATSATTTADVGATTSSDTAAQA